MGTNQKVESKSSDNDDKEFNGKILGMNPKELRDEEENLRREAAAKGAVLAAVKKGERGALAAYVKKAGPTVMISQADTDKQTALITAAHLQDERSVLTIQEDKDPAQEVARAKQWLNETFPTRKTEALLVKDDHGNAYVSCLGISGGEVQAAMDLQFEQQKAMEKAKAVASQLEKIRSGPQNTAPDGGVSKSAEAGARKGDVTSALSPADKAPPARQDAGLLTVAALGGGNAAAVAAQAVGSAAAVGQGNAR